MKARTRGFTPIGRSSRGWRRRTGNALHRRAQRVIRSLPGLLLTLLLSACLPLSPAASQSKYDLEQWFPGDAGAQALAVAAEHGDAKEVRRLMREEKVNPDTVFSTGGTPLVAWPIVTENPAGLKAMLENGADPNVALPYPLPPDRTPRNNDSAMVWAARADGPVYLQLLLDHGGDPNTRNVNNETLLKQARLMGNQWENVKLLVERGANVNALSQGSAFVDMYAGLGGFMQTHWLLEHGAKPTPHTVEAVFWRPSKLDDQTWQRRCQQWLIQRGYERPVMPEYYRRMREAFGFPTEEADIPLL